MEKGPHIVLLSCTCKFSVQKSINTQVKCKYYCTNEDMENICFRDEQTVSFKQDSEWQKVYVRRDFIVVENSFTGHWFIFVFCKVHIAPNLYSVLNLTENLINCSKEMAVVGGMCNFKQLQIWHRNVCR